MCSSLTAIWKAIAVYCMVMSLAMSVLSAISVATYECRIADLTTYKPTNEYMVYIAYFFSVKCIDLNSTSPEFVVLNDEPGYRTWCWSIGYLTLNLVWFLSSIQLYVVPKYWEERAGTCLTAPWVLTTFAVLSADVAACVVYGKDYEKFETLESFIANMGLLILKPSPLPTEYFPLMSVVMLVVFSKAVIFWIINFACFITVCILLVKVGKPDDATIRLETRSVPIDYYYPSNAVTNPAFQDEDHTEMQEISSSSRYGNSSDDREINNRWTLVTLRRQQEQLQNAQQSQQNRPLQHPQEQLYHLQQQHRHYQAEDMGPQSPTASTLDGWSRYTGSPTSILKTPQKPRGVRYAPETIASHEPWTYLPPERSQQYATPDRPRHRPDQQYMYY